MGVQKPALDRSQRRARLQLPGFTDVDQPSQTARQGFDSGMPKDVANLDLPTLPLKEPDDLNRRY